MFNLHGWKRCWWLCYRLVVLATQTKWFRLYEAVNFHEFLLSWLALSTLTATFIGLSSWEKDYRNKQMWGSTGKDQARLQPKKQTRESLFYRFPGLGFTESARALIASKINELQLDCWVSMIQFVIIVKTWFIVITRAWTFWFLDSNITGF